MKYFIDFWIIFTVFYFEPIQTQGQKVTDTDTFVRNGLQKSLKKYVHYNRLEYGAQCSWEHEKGVGQLWHHYVSYLTASDLKVIRSEGISLLKSLTDIINSKTLLCNYYSQLTCDPNTLRCQCLSGTYMGVNITSSREGQTCVLKRGSFCTPANFLGLNIQKSMTCEVGTTCVLATTNSNGCANTQTQQNSSAGDTEAVLAQTNTIDPNFVNKLSNGFCICNECKTNLPSHFIVLTVFVVAIFSV